jgi:hypothetical protein
MYVGIHAVKEYTDGVYTNNVSRAKCPVKITQGAHLSALHMPTYIEEMLRNIEEY